MYNSHNPDETDMTMINQSFLYANANESTSDSVVKHLQQANRAKATTITASDYVYIEHDRLEFAKQIEEILSFYRRDLKHESTSEYDCNQQLIRRLVDVVRPLHSSNENEMKHLDQLYEEISELQDVRHIEQKEKIEQLTSEVTHLKKLILTSTNEGEEKHANPMTKAFQINSMINYDQWLQLEEECKHLHNLVEAQKNKINELIKLLASDENPPRTPSSGTSIVLNERLTAHPLDTTERRAITVQNLRTLSRLPSSPGAKRCLICNQTFPFAASEDEIEKHIHRCLTALDNTSLEIKEYECPKCARYFPVNDSVYLQHLTECLND